MALGLFISVFALLLLLGAPIAFTFLVPSMLYMVLSGTSLILVGQTMLQQFNNFVLIAIPLFILAGELMNTSGITNRIFSFSHALAGHIRGGFGHVNVIGSLIFAGISGSSAADAAGMGRVEIKAMVERGYRPAFAAAITAASSTVGPIIPPSIGLVIYGAIAEVGVDWLFMAGVVPGFLLGVALMVAIWVQVVTGRELCPVEPFAGWRALIRTFVGAIAALAMPVIIIGGLVTGWLTPTEAGCAAVLLALALGAVYGDLRTADLLPALMRAVHSSATVMFILATVGLFAWVLTIERAPDHVAQAMFSLTSEPWVMMLLILVTLLILGCFETATANLLICTPILVPIAPALGIDLVHLGVILVFALAIGQITPPVGMTLFIVMDITKLPMSTIVKAITPYLIAMIVALFLVAYWPALTLWLPRQFGYSG